jgi:hypothetical protein
VSGSSIKAALAKQCSFVILTIPTPRKKKSLGTGGQGAERFVNPGHIAQEPPKGKGDMDQTRLFV